MGLNTTAWSWVRVARKHTGLAKLAGGVAELLYEEERRRQFRASRGRRGSGRGKMGDDACEVEGELGVLREIRND